MKITLFLASFLVFGFISCTQEPSSDKPNIVYILTDDLGYGDVSVNNPEGKITTPNIDQLANSGIRFTDAHSGSAVCTPTRYGVLTGRYSWRGVLKKGVTWSYDSSIIAPSRLTVADLLKDNGYETACVGKWHLGLDWAKNDSSNYPIDFTKPVGNPPNKYGFDYSYVIPASLDIPPYVYLENELLTEQPNRETEDKSEYGWWRKGPTGSDFTHETVLQNFADRAISYITKEHEKPFFLYLPLAAPHTPILPSEKWKGKSGLSEYGDFVLMVDDVIGQVTQALKEKGIYDNTLIVVTSDNGCAPLAGVKEMEAMGHFASGPLRGYKSDIYEGGHRVPFIMKWGEQIPQGMVSNETICLTDFMATAASIIGEEIPENAAEDSYDLSKVWNINLENKEPLRVNTIHHSAQGVFAIREGDWKLILASHSGGWGDPTPKSMADKPGVQLYNLANDIGEQENLAKANPEIVKRLKATLRANIEAGRSTPGPNQPYDKPEGWDILEVF